MYFLEFTSVIYLIKLTLTNGNWLSKEKAPSFGGSLAQLIRV
jgi:hypothetical protein